MPFYDYSCNNCEYIFEEYNNFRETYDIVCPKCGSKNYKKVILQAPEVNMGENTVKPVNYRR